MAGIRRFGSGRFRYTKGFFFVPYAIVFGLIGFVGLQLTQLSSAAPDQQNEVTLVVAKSSYYAGENVRFTITNNSAQAVSVVNNCPDVPLEVSRWQDGAWLQLHSSANASKCINEPRSYVINAKTSVSASYIYWPDLFKQVGRYRLVAPIEQQSFRPSVEFDVVAL